jgi:hypothetical protein
MTEPNIYKVIIACKFSYEEWEKFKYVLAYSRSEAEKVITPFIKQEEKGKYLLSVKQVIKVCPIDFYSHSFRNYILNENYDKYKKFREKQESIEKNPLIHSRPPWVPED